MKTQSIVAELLQEDRDTDVTEEILAFHNFAKAPQKKCACFGKNIERKRPLLIRWRH